MISDAYRIIDLLSSLIYIIDVTIHKATVEVSRCLNRTFEEKRTYRTTGNNHDEKTRVTAKRGIPRWPYTLTDEKQIERLCYKAAQRVKFGAQLFASNDQT